MLYQALETIMDIARYCQINISWLYIPFIATMSAKSLGTLPVIYIVDELQNPLLCTTMLFEGDTNSTKGRNYVFPNR